MRSVLETLILATIVALLGLLGYVTGVGWVGLVVGMVLVYLLRKSQHSD
ncbi:MAG: hypothetical protein ACRD8U_04105 [Pyrinomonadaceae bacterium]